VRLLLLLLLVFTSLLSLLHCRRNYKWWHALLDWVFDVAFINAVILFNETTTSKPPDSIVLLRQLASYLCSTPPKPKFGTAKRKRSTSNSSLSSSPVSRARRASGANASEGHYPVKTATATCVFCKQNQAISALPARSSYSCEACGVPLCVTCFKPWHLRNDTQQ
jgi:hypothetical protein